MAKEKFVIVSNRLPVSVSKVDDKLEFTTSSGGLATALSRLQTKHESRVWVGWPGIANEDITASDKKIIIEELKKHGCSPVFLSKQQIALYYDGYSNDTIWPLFHYFQTLVKHDLDYWDGYNEVNELFKKAVLKHAGRDSYIWIHDYHLMLLPKMIRDSLPESTIGFFLHVPFPSYELFRLLPNRSEILEGLLGANLIGFHIYDYARHFLSSILRILAIDNTHGTITIGDRAIKVDAFPISIDYSRFAEASKDKKIQKEIDDLEKNYQGKKIILSVDRLDYSKGIMNRLEAFEQFLKENEQAYTKKIVLVVIAVPSRTEVETYRELRSNIEKTISRINGQYGQVDWTPISYHFKNLPFEQVAALFWVADVALLTPLRDGMNLVAKEYVATKQDKAGVLILSEMTGAVDELPESIRINPNNRSEIVKALTLALKIPKKTQIQVIKSMQRRLSKYTIDRWSEDFVEQLEESKRWQKSRGKKIIDKNTEDRILRSYNKSKKRLILLDYDGTIRAFVSSPNPKRAAPSKSLKLLIKSLAENPSNELCIVSGRPRNVLESWFEDIDISLSSEHGAWIKTEGEWSRQQISLGEYRKKIVSTLEKYLDRTPGAKIEQKDFSIVWHYRNVPTELAHARNASIMYELNNSLGSSDFGVYKGNKIIEIKPKNIHKGIVAEDLIGIHEPDFILSIGDDYTDEDMFHSLPDEAFSIKVGLGDTAARYQLISVNDVHELLMKLNDQS